MSIWSGVGVGLKVHVVQQFYVRVGCGGVGVWGVGPVVGGAKTISGVPRLLPAAPPMHMYVLYYFKATVVANFGFAI
jgi:hypothetical protein